MQQNNFNDILFTNRDYKFTAATGIVSINLLYADLKNKVLLILLFIGNPVISENEMQLYFL